jgi:TolB-like protein/Flp pilus assembly protein TadD
MELRQFITELKSRKVYRTAAVYSAGAWALLQVADVLFPVVGLPDWSVTAVLLLAALGFPLALVLSWLFELTPEGEGGVRIEADGDGGTMPVSRVIEFTLIILLCGLVGYLYVGRLTEPPADVTLPEIAETSIAVMPFVNLSGEKEMEYLGDGLAEEILNLLARLTELNVAARTSSFYFKDKDVDIQTIGSHLGVANVLEGSIRYAGDRVRVTAQLIKAGDGFHIWSETYDRELQDILQIQDEIAAEVVDKLRLLLSDESRETLSRDTNVDPVAYDYYLQARSFLRGPPDVANLRFAVDLFEKAVVLDPEFAEAYAGQCDALLRMYSSNRQAGDFRRAEKACERALRLDRRSPSVYIALGQLYINSGQFQQALDEFNLALSLGAMQAEAHLGLGDTYLSDGKFDLAEQHYQTSLSLQPRYWRALMQMAKMLAVSGRYAEAIPYYQTVTELMPDSDLAFNNLGAVYSMQGDFESASEAWASSLALAPSAITLANMATSLYMLRRFDEALLLYHQAVEYAPESFELWGNLGDTYRFATDGAEMVAPMYQRAIALGEQQLQINPSDADSTAMLAHYYAALGDRERALEKIAAARQLPHDSFYVEYSIATAFVSLGEPQRALQALGAAMETGFPRHVAVADASLDKLKGYPRFEELTRSGQ